MTKVYGSCTIEKLCAGQLGLSLILSIYIS
nr:MAG TPA: hypothetical protein [Caudoviricetes sp.]